MMLCGAGAQVEAASGFHDDEGRALWRFTPDPPKPCAAPGARARLNSGRALAPLTRIGAPDRTPAHEENGFPKN